jgi:hypothetical protein
MSHRMLIFKAGIDFHTLAILFVLGNLMTSYSGDLLPHTTYDDVNSEIVNFLHMEIDVFKNKFHNEIDFSQGIDAW